MLSERHIDVCYTVGVVALVAVVALTGEFRIDGAPMLLLMLWSSLGWIALKLLFTDVEKCTSCSDCYKKMGLHPVKH